MQSLISKTFKKLHLTENIVLYVFIVIGFILIFYENILIKYDNQQFIELAQSFNNYKFYFLPSAANLYDSVFFQGKNYWPLGPLPGVLLMPFVGIFGAEFRQGYLQFVLIVLNYLLLFNIAKKITNNTITSLWLSFAFIFSTAFLGIAVLPWSWQFAQVVATTFTLLVIYEYVHNRQWLLIGLYLGLAISARFNLILIVSFFILHMLTLKTDVKKKLTYLCNIFLPIGLIILMLLLYNYFRFHSFFEQGYSYQNLTDPFLIANRSYSLWGFIHIPANLYYFLLKGPDAVFIPGTKILSYPYLQVDPWGMSIIFTSPVFLWLIKSPLKNKDVLYAFVTVCMLVFAIFGYYGIGYEQFGYRYALDFYPFLFLMLVYTVKHKLSLLFKCIILLSFCFNYYLIFYKL